MDLVNVFIERVWIEYLTDITIAWNSVIDWFIAIIVFFWLLIVFAWFKKKALTALLSLTKRTTTTADSFAVHALQTLPRSFYRITAVFITAKFLLIPETFQQAIDIAFIVIAISQLWLTLGRVILYLLHEKYFVGEGSSHTMAFLRIIIKVLVFVIITLMILNNLWVEITPLITSLWIIGIAIAFALQNILEDLFSSVSLIIDKPFIVGDFIEFSGNTWTVKSIGIKTTRIDTIRWEELVVANRKLTNETIRNYWKMEHRTITATITLQYTKKTEQLKQFIPQVHELFDAIDLVTLQKFVLTELTSRWAEYSYRYTVESNDYFEYLEKQQEINFGFLDLLEAEGLSIAKPISIVTIHGDTEQKSQ